MDSETRQVLQEYAEEIRRLNREVNNLKRGTRRPQLAYSSLESGQNVEVRDDDGNVRTRIGWQPDGTAGLITEGGDAPPAPTAPTVEPSLGGLRVTWDGAMVNDVAKPSDLGFVQVHVSTTSGFVPDDTTRTGSIPREGGIQPVAPLPYVEHYVRLVGVTTGGITGDSSVEATATPVQVDEPDLTAGSVTAAHIQAGAITADLLEAVLTLASRVVAGDPSAARVELNSDGLRAYDDNEELTVSVDAATGDATFSGTITGSDIVGSRIDIGSSPDAYGAMEAVGGRATVAMTSGDDTRVAIEADDTTALVAAMSVINDETHPFMLTEATLDSVWSIYSNGAGSEIRFLADTDYASVNLTPEESDVGSPSAGPGVLYAFRTGDVPVVSLQSPQVHEGDGAGRRALFFVHGTNGVDQSTADLSFYGHRQLFGNDVIDGTAQSDDGVMELRSTHSILSVRHRFVRGEWLGVLPSGTTTGSFVTFTESEYEHPVFKTGASGAVRIVINAYGVNNNTTESLLTISFGVGSYGASRTRSAEIRAVRETDPPWQQCSVVYLDGLDPDNSYILEPRWRLSSGSWGTTAELSTTGDNSIVIEPLA